MMDDEARITVSEFRPLDGDSLSLDPSGTPQNHPLQPSGAMFREADRSSAP